MAAKGEQLPFASNSIDFVLAIDSIHHSDYPFDMIESMWDVVKPGGYMIIKDHNPTNSIRFLQAAVSDVLGNTSNTKDQIRQYGEILKRLFKGDLRAVKQTDKQTSLVRGTHSDDTEMTFRYIHQEDWQDMIYTLLGNDINNANNSLEKNFQYDYVKKRPYLAPLDQRHCLWVLQKPQVQSKES